MFKNVKSIVSGMIIGGMLVSGVSYASSYMTTIEVSIEPITIKYNSKEIKPLDETLPASFIYNGTTYVPLRFIGKAVDKEIQWDVKTRTIGITDSTTTGNSQYQESVNADFQTINFHENNTDIPKEIREWAMAYYKTEYHGYKILDGATYALIARGESPHPGYGVAVTGLLKSATQATIQARYTDPDPSMMYPMVITYPALLIKIDQRFDEVNIEIERGDQKTTKYM
jgi:hypothetical protein